MVIVESKNGPMAICGHVHWLLWVGLALSWLLWVGLALSWLLWVCILRVITQTMISQ
jgi:hypothetical protein